VTVVGGAGSGGEGGDPTVTPRDCETDSAPRCSGLIPEVCNEFGQWVQNETEAAGECAVQCVEGRCVECLPDQKRCAVCEEGDAACNTNQPQSCVDGAWKSEGAACAGYCDDGSCVMPPSCPVNAGDQAKCGTESCCKSLLVPGGTFKRSFDGDEYSDDTFPATVSAFVLDKFEVNVGRFRPFVNAYSELNLSNGDGKSPHIADDKGWSTSFTRPADKDALIAELKCDAAATWSDDAIVNNELPINCVSFAVAYAFCIWDGGRLPTEAEWNFAAAGGDLQRAYPWARPEGEEPITTEHANWGSADAGPLNVGSKPLGNARWGQADMASNVREWVLDYYNDEYRTPCVDCLRASAEDERSLRGGAWTMAADGLLVSLRSSLEPITRRNVVGFRCARDSNKRP
jgi:formylglycine-generating enzyme required for sulfatase activity